MLLQDLQTVVQAEQFEIKVANARQFAVDSEIRLRAVGNDTDVYIGGTDTTANGGIKLTNIEGHFSTVHYADLWKKIQNCNYHASIIKREQDVLTVCAIYGFLEKEFPTPFEIAVTDKQVKGSNNKSLRRPEEVKNHIQQNYVLKLGNNSYIAIAKHAHAKDGSFMMIRGAFAYSITEHTRRELGVVDSTSNNTDKSAETHEPSDTIWTINSNEIPFRGGDEYTIELWKCKLILADETTAAKQKESVKAFVSTGMEKYLSAWQQYTEIEMSIITEISEKAGKLHYDKINHVSGTREYELSITNPEYLETFWKCLDASGNDHKVDIPGHVRNRKGVLVEGTILATMLPPEMGTNSIGIRVESNEVSPLSIGDVSLSTVLAAAQYKRRNAALQRIQSGQSAKPNLALLISGKSSDLSFGNTIDSKTKIAPFSDAVLQCFPKGHPTDTQRAAVSIALNTPDFAIIQGPPGTGKTTVINAIMRALAEKEKDPSLSYGRNLLTAYQRDTTSHLSEKLRVYGLPVPTYRGFNDILESDEHARDAAMDIWIKEKREELAENNPSIGDAAPSEQLMEQITLLKMRFNPDNSTVVQTKDLLDTFLVALDECEAAERENYRNKLISIQNASIDELLDKKHSMSLREPLEFQNYRDTIAQLKKKAAMHLVSDNSLLDKWYASLLPIDDASMSDNGSIVINDVLTRFTSESYSENTKKIANTLQALYAESNVNYRKINTLKYMLIVSVAGNNWPIVDRELNSDVEKIISGILTFIERNNTSNEQRILAEYHNAFDISNDEALKDMLAEFMTVIAATHQKAVSKEVRAHKDSSLTTIQEAESHIEYDNVLIDEAARSCPPDLLIPLACAKDRMILVGDQNQLPQFVSDAAYKQISGFQKEELDSLIKKTMFERLIEQAALLESIDHKQRFIQLNEQYRMPQTLGDVISHNFYKKQPVLSPLGNDRNHTVDDLPFIAGKHLVWIDVTSGSQRRSEGNSLERESEAKAIVKVLREMIENFSDATSKYEFAIITFYNGQKRLIEQLLSADAKIKRWMNEHKEKEGSIKVGTVDAFQGLEADVVFLSLVRSVPQYDRKKDLYGFTSNANRQCVALSRAKRSLVIVGDSSMVSGNRAKEAAENMPAIAEIYNLCLKEDVTDACIRKA